MKKIQFQAKSNFDIMKYTRVTFWDCRWAPAADSVAENSGKIFSDTISMAPVLIDTSDDALSEWTKLQLQASALPRYVSDHTNLLSP